MKFPNILLVASITIALFSCKDDDSSTAIPIPMPNPKVESGFIDFNKDRTPISLSPANLQFRTNGVDTIYDITAVEGFAKTFAIALEESQYKIGTYELGDTFSGKPYATYAEDLLGNGKSFISSSGTVTISEINTQGKRVKGTFEFKAFDAANIDSISVTNGKFNVRMP